MKKNKILISVYITLYIIAIANAIISCISQNFSHFCISCLSMLLFAIPSLAEKFFRIRLTVTLKIIILLFIFASEILGEILNFYKIFAWWDILLHTTNGFLCAAIGISLVNVLNKNVFSQISPLFLFLTAFCFSMTIGVLWEFFEFACDQWFGLDMQMDTVVSSIHSSTLDPINHSIVSIENIKEVIVNGQKLEINGYLDIGLIDTMEDLLVNCVGALTFCIIAYVGTKKQRIGKLIKNLSLTSHSIC